jgi:ribosome-associated protein
MSDRVGGRAEQARGSTGLVLEAAEAAASKKAERIAILDISKQLVITDHFLICSGNTERQVRTISDEVERRILQSRDIRPIRREGERESRWIVLDYGDFIVHVFHREERDYYDLERLWADAEVVPFEEPWEGSDEPAAAEAT